MTTRNPFPGMNPFCEQQWRDAHSRLVTYLHDVLQQCLPPDLMARTEQETVAIGASGMARAYRPDVSVSEPWTLKESSATAVAAPPTLIPATEPIRVFLDEEIERWLEIHDTADRLITAIELLSPTNKLESTDRDHYLRKRRAFISGGANTVEIDLVRQGAWLFAATIRNVLQQAGACYAVCVVRAAHPGEHEVYPIRLRERLPPIRVPLRPADPDVVVDLQPLIDQCHERGRYHFLDYRKELDPPLGAEDAQWANDLLTKSGLR